MAEPVGSAHEDMSQGIRLSTLLVLLVFVSVAPMAIFSGVMIRSSWAQHRAVLEERNIETARAVASLVDETVQSVIDALNRLTTLQLFEDDYKTGFTDLASRVQDVEPGWRTMILADRDGRVLTTSPSGALSRFQGTPEWATESASTGRPMVSNLMGDGASRPFSYVVATPVLQDGRVVKVLAVEVDAAGLSDLLERQRPGALGVVGLTDRAYRLVARSRNSELYVGRPASPTFISATSEHDEGSFRAQMLEGTPAYSSFSRAPLTGWIAGVGLAASEVDAPMWTALRRLVYGGLSLLLVGVLVAFAVGRRVVGATAASAASASALARGEPVRPIKSRIAEIQKLSSGIAQAATILKDRNRERDRAEAERAKAAAALEDALRQEHEARQEAERASRGKDEFVATVSHELRTPLNAIFGWVRLLRSGALDEDASRHALEVIDRNTRAQAQLIDDLLDISRVITGRLDTTLEPLEVAPVVHAAVDTVRPNASAKGVRLETSIAADVSPVAADPHRLAQIVTNLLVNAVKFTPSGGSVHVATRQEGGTIVIAVSDTGVGIRPEQLPHVFQRYWQASTSQSRSYGGLGIGLTLVHRLVELHQGTASVESEGEGRGATFTVRLPALEVASVTMETVAPASSTDADARLDGVRALVVDDDPDARELVGTVLSGVGANVTHAASVVEALGRLEHETPDLIVSDIAMPNGTGYDLVRQVRAREHWNLLPIVALTAQGRTDDRERALAAGFTDYLGKPIEPAVLVQAMRRALGRVDAEGSRAN
jgi:signal transduction histidine kinase/ActR/RegA family two-component response regulator